MARSDDSDSRSDLHERFDGVLARVLSVEEGGCAFTGRYLNGVISRWEFEEPTGLGRGDVILLNESGWREVPRNTWPDDSSVGVVRALLDDGVAVEGPMGIRIIHGPPGIPVVVGNTVQYDDYGGISLLVSEDPLRNRDEVPMEEVGRYRINLDDGAEVGFESFGGYEPVIARARELIETQLERREELAAIGAQPVKGVIFTGPPGTGKTHLARVIAHVAGAEFYLVSGPSIVSKYVGDSEETLRRIFEAAAKDERAIIFFDEVDSIAARRSGDSQGDSKRLVAQLLTLLDGFEASRNVIVIAATNRIEDVDEALLRPGRFDWEIPFELPSLEDRFEILRVRAETLSTSGNLPLAEIAQLTDGWSGAELSAIWTEAALLAAGDRRREIADEDLAVAYERVSSRPSRLVMREHRVS